MEDKIKRMVSHVSVCICDSPVSCHQMSACRPSWATVQPSPSSHLQSTIHYSYFITAKCQCAVHCFIFIRRQLWTDVHDCLSRGGGPLVGPTNCLEVRVQGPIAGFRWGSGIHYWHRGIGRSACWSLEAQLFGSSGSHKVAGHMRISCDASPEHTGWEVVELLAIPATDFVSRDFINAICAGIAKIKQDSTTLLMTQVWQWAALDHTGFLGLLHIAVEFSLSQADNLGWYYWRHWPTWVTRPTANDYVTVIV